MWDEPAPNPKVPRWLALLLWIGAFWLSLATLIFLNDHFGRISPARQIAFYGELPFRDYFDPGYFLTELASAALQWLLGDNLLGEALLTTAFVATGTVLVFVLAVRLTGSVVASLTASVLALLLFPRAYDYDKVLFYPLGLLLCWRFVERPCASRTWALACGLVVAALFRYDTGAYIAVTMVVCIGIVSMGNWQALRRHTTQLLLAIACLSLPAVVFIHYEGGLGSAVDQVITYAGRETARTQLPAQQVLPGSWTPANANVFLTYLVRLLPLAGAVLIVRAARARRASRQTIARLAGLVTFCVCLNLFILRDPVGARLGGMAGPVAILAAWIAYGAWHAGEGIARVARQVAVGLVLALTIWSVSASAAWGQRLQLDIAYPSLLGRQFAAWTASPPRLDDVANRSIVGLVKYLRECTAPTDRVLATWFAPDIYFYAKRGFAGRMAAMFGGHWSEPRFERRSVEALASQSVPVIVTRTVDQGLLEDDYPLVTAYLREHYSLAGTSDFGDADIGKGGYSVWARNDRRPVRAYADTSLPCF